jgi:formate dehydrogenase major subunit
MDRHVPDGPWPPLQNQDGTDNPAGRYSFIMTAEGHACLFANTLEDGPFAEHYEPVESPIMNPMSKQQINPVIKIWRPDEIGKVDEYPVIATTYRVSEHWQTGSMTRNIPWLAELMPDAFVEISNELAEEKGIANGEKIRISSKRGSVEMPALVTSRFKPFNVGGQTFHHIGLIWHYGFKGIAKGPAANVLTPHVGDANTMIPEYKAFLCNIEKI